MKEKISIIIPTYNEEKVIGNCLGSLENQSYQQLEIILIDDGSTDNTLKIVENLKFKIRERILNKSKSENLKMFHQDHLGPGPARNLGASKAKGKILVFVDADMTFEKNFVKDLIQPILQNKTIGTFSKNEMVSNKDNLWSIYWNINRNIFKDRMLPLNYPNEAPVFRAILKKEFDKVGGFDTTGEYTDDWSLSKKLGIKSTAVPGAFYYHANPSTLKEVFKQARWIGKNEFISGTPIRRLRSLIFYSPPMSLVIGVYKSLVNHKLSFIVFKLIYDTAIRISVIKSFFGESKSK